MGPNYSLEYETKNIPTITIIANLEANIINMDANSQSEIRTNKVNTITKFKNRKERTNNEQKISNRGTEITLLTITISIYRNQDSIFVVLRHFQLSYT